MINMFSLAFLYIPGYSHKSLIWGKQSVFSHLRDISKEAAKLCRPTKVHCTRSAKGIANKLKNLSCTKVKFSYKCYHGIAHWLEINQQSIGIVQQFLAWLWQEFCAMLCIMSWWRMCMRYAAVAFGRLHQFIQNLGVCTVYIWRNWRPPIPPIVRYIQSYIISLQTLTDSVKLFLLHHEYLYWLNCCVSLCIFLKMVELHCLRTITEFFNK